MDSHRNSLDHSKSDFAVVRSRAQGKYHVKIAIGNVNVLYSHSTNEFFMVCFLFMNSGERELSQSMDHHNFDLHRDCPLHLVLRPEHVLWRLEGVLCRMLFAHDILDQ